MNILTIYPQAPKVARAVIMITIHFLVKNKSILTLRLIYKNAKHHIGSALLSTIHPNVRITTLTPIRAFILTVIRITILIIVS